jgi:hypothetical protein
MEINYTRSAFKPNNPQGPLILDMGLAAMIIVDAVSDLAAKIHVSPFMHIGLGKDFLCQKIF